MGALVRLLWSDCSGQIALVRLLWSDCSGRIALVRLHWSDCSGQIALVRLLWSDCTGQIALVRLVHCSGWIFLCVSVTMFCCCFVKYTCFEKLLLKCENT